MTERVLVVGASGHARVVIDILQRMPDREIVGVVDRDLPPGERFEGCPVVGRDDAMGEIGQEHPFDAVIVAIGDNGTRSKVVRRIEAAVPDALFTTAVHPSARIGGGARIGAGTVVMAGAVINPGSVVGSHAIVNTLAGVDHDCVIGDYASVAPGVTLGGSVVVKDHAVLSLGCKVIHGVTIGRGALIAAGAVVVDDVPERGVMMGIPARLERRREIDEPYL